MTESISVAIRRQRRPAGGFAARAGRRTFVASLYLLTAPVTVAAGLLLVLGGLCAGTVGLLVPGGSRLAAGALALARWPADVERWRIATVRPPEAGAQDTGQRQRQRLRLRLHTSAAASEPGLWLDVAHAVAVLPVVLVTAVVTWVWWFVAVAAVTFPLRYPSGSLRWRTPRRTSCRTRW